MPTFAYTAIDQAGNAVTGTLVAADPSLARTQLERRAMTVRTLDPVAGRPTLLNYAPEPTGGLKERVAGWFGGMRRGGGVPSTAVTGFYRDMATMLSAGLGIRQALTTARQSAASASPTFLAVVTALGDHVADGGALGEGMAKHPDVFEDLEVRAVEAGELAGILDEALRRLANLRESRHRLRQRVISALTYPAMVLGIATVITILLMTFVVPNILAPILEQGGTPPLPTRLVGAVSNALLYGWWIIILLLIGAVFLFRWWVRTPAGRLTCDALVLKIPVIGGLALRHTIARAATIIATLLRSGIGLVESVQVAQRTCPNVVLAGALGEWEQGLHEGLAPEMALARTRAFPPLMTEMVAVGSQSGKMEETLDKLAETYEQQVQDTADRLAAIAQPALMLFLAGLVLLIILAVFLPYIQLLTSLGG